MDETKKELEKAVEALALNADVSVSNTVALLDRNLDLADRFAGETRDHVLEAVKEARDRAENEGRIRCAQLLEAVMVANESSGELLKKRTALEKFFNENQNILSGTVIAELEKCGMTGLPTAGESSATVSTKAMSAVWPSRPSVYPSG